MILTKYWQISLRLNFCLHQQFSAPNPHLTMALVCLASCFTWILRASNRPLGLGESPLASHSLDSESHSDSPVDSITQPRSVLNGFYRKAWDHRPSHRDESGTQHHGHKNKKNTPKPPNIHNHPPIGRKEPSDSPPLRSSLGSEVDRENSEVVVHAAASSGYKSDKRHHHRHHHHHKHRSHGGEDRHSRHQRY